MEHKGNTDILSSSNQGIDDSGFKVFSDNKQNGNIQIIDETKEISKENSLKETLEKHDGDKGIPGNLKCNENVKSSYEYACNESSKVNHDLECQEKTADECKTSRQNRNDNTEIGICETQTYCDSHYEKDEIITGSSANTDDNEKNCNEEPVETLKKGLGSIFLNGNRASFQNKYKQFNPFDARPKQIVNNNILSAEDSPDCEKKSATSFEKTSEDCKDYCDFCDNISRFMCKSCKYFYCEKCLNRLHPAVGLFKSHKIVSADSEIKIEHEKCVEHGLGVQLYCTYCEQKRCPECASTKCNLHFKGRISSCDIEREKTGLVEELEKATSKLAFIEKYKERVQDELDKTVMTGLYRREQIRQEFLSFHDLLLQKEEKILIHLEQSEKHYIQCRHFLVLPHKTLASRLLETQEDVQERTSHIRDTLQAVVASVEREDAKLTAAVTDLVQSTDDEKFIEEYVKGKEICQQVDIKIKEFDKSWAKNSTYKCSRLLDNHFSMFIEKKQLSDELDEIVGEESQLVFRQKTLYIDDISRPLQILDYLQEPKIPTSTEVHYIVQAFVRGKLVYETDTKNLQDIQLNKESTLIFNGGNRFLLKVTPVFKCIISNQKHQSREGQPAYMFLVVAYLFQAETTDTKAKVNVKRRSPAQRKFDDNQVLKVLVRHNNTAYINPSFKKRKVNVGKKICYRKKVCKDINVANRYRKGGAKSKELFMTKEAGLSKELVMKEGAGVSNEPVMAKGAGKNKELVMTKEAEISKEPVMAKGAGKNKELVMTKKAEISKEPVMAKGAGKNKELVMTTGAGISKEPVMAKGAGKNKELVMTKGAGISKEPVMAKGAGKNKELAMTNISQAEETKQKNIQKTGRCIRKAIRKIRR